jgi:hypothetical protein
MHGSFAAAEAAVKKACAYVPVAKKGNRTHWPLVGVEGLLPLQAVVRCDTKHASTPTVT